MAEIHDRQIYADELRPYSRSLPRHALLAEIRDACEMLMKAVDGDVAKLSEEEQQDVKTALTFMREDGHLPETTVVALNLFYYLETLLDSDGKTAH